jgi:hypothetical protein
MITITSFTLLHSYSDARPTREQGGWAGESVQNCAGNLGRGYELRRNKYKYLRDSNVQQQHNHHQHHQQQFFFTPSLPPPSRRKHLALLHTLHVFNNTLTS